MQPEIGKIYDGKVTGITNFGAFVELEPGVTGMVHISEVANTFVSEIKDHLAMGQEVKVKVLAVTEEGKISLSIKKAAPPVQREFRKNPAGGDRSFRSSERTDRSDNRGDRGDRGDKSDRRGSSPQNRNDRKNFRQPHENVPQTKEAAFEDMMNKFKQTSDERMSDIKKNIDSKRRNTSRKRSG